MAVRFLSRDVSDLCLGKPELIGIEETAPLSDALTASKRSGDTYVSVWARSFESPDGACLCVGKICMTDVILFLCKEENLADPFKAFEAPVSQILSLGASVVTHLESDCSLLEAIDYILEGTQNLVIPIQNHRVSNSRKRLLEHDPKYCWLVQEDVVRFLLNSIGTFSPIPTRTIDSLDVIKHDIMAVHYNEPASSAVSYLYRAHNEQSSVAVVDEKNRLMGEISPSTLSYCNETAATAITTLSAWDLMAYIDCGDPPEDLVQLMKIRLEERNLGEMLNLMDEYFPSSASSSSSYCSSDDEFGSTRNGLSGRHHQARSSQAVVCSRKSSLVAVMIQSLTHRVNCVWVVEEDNTLVGAVTLAGILKVFRSSAGSGIKKEG